MCYDKMYDGVINIILGILKEASRAAAYHDLGGKYKMSVNSYGLYKELYILCYLHAFDKCLTE